MTKNDPPDVKLDPNPPGMANSSVLHTGAADLEDLEDTERSITVLPNVRMGITQSIQNCTE